MNAKLEALISQISKDEFRETEIIIISDSDVFNVEDLKKLEVVIKNNDWVKKNLRVLMLEPNNIVTGALGIDGRRGFFVSFTHGINSIGVDTKTKLADVLQMLRTGDFHYSSIGFGDNRFPAGIKELEDDDLQELVTAINASDWCQKYLRNISLSHAHISRVPAIKCKNLQELSIYANPISEIEELDCPNLLHITAHQIGKFNIQVLKSCSNLEQVDAFGSNLRVPPNIMTYPNLYSLNVLDSSPFSPLGIYAILLMRKKIQIGDKLRDLAAKFAVIYSQDRDFRLPENFYDHGRFYFGIEESKESIDVDKFIDEFEIPQHFFEDQVNSVVSFMKKIYYKLPFEVSDDGIATIDHNISPNRFKGYAKLEALNAEYRTARGLLFATIDGLIERADQFGDIESSNIFTAAEEKATASLVNLEAHNEFFLSELYSDFENLREIFIAVGKPTEGIDAYITDNSEKWAVTLDVKRKLFKEGKDHLKESQAKKEQSKLKLKLIEESKFRETEAAKKQKTFSESCVIS